MQNKSQRASRVRISKPIPDVSLKKGGGSDLNFFLVHYTDFE